MQSVWRGHCNSSFNILLEYKDDKKHLSVPSILPSRREGEPSCRKVETSFVFWVTATLWVSFPRKSSFWKGFWWPNLKSFFFLFLKVAKFFFFVFFFILLLSEVLTLLGMTSPEGRRCAGAGNNRAVLQVSEDTSLAFSLSLSGPFFLGWFEVSGLSLQSIFCRLCLRLNFNEELRERT